MIIGAIESVQANSVAGWIHCRSADVKDATVLAFLNGRCVGAGKVNLFRQDLKDAGLGDGHLGFRFPIAVPSLSDALNVTVTLEGCEAMLLQRGAVLSNVNAPRTVESFLGGLIPGLARRNWLRARGWMEPAQADLLEAVDNFGVASLSADGSHHSAEAAAREMFEAVILEPVEIGVLEVKAARQLRSTLLAADGPLADAGLFVLSADKRLTLRVVESPFLGIPTEMAEPDMAGAVDYPLGPRNLVAIRRWISFDLGRASADRSVKVFYPKRPSAETEERATGEMAEAMG